MTKYLYILIILYNLNILLNFYVEIMIKTITIFNYKNTGNYLNNSSIFDIILYSNKNNNIVKNLVKVTQHL